MKLTVNDVNYIVNEASKRIISEAYRDAYGRTWSKGGNIPRDGMTGGSWGQSEIYGKYYIDIQELVEMLDDDTYNEDLHSKLESMEDKLFFNVKANYGYDSSVGIPESVEDVEVDITPAINAIRNMSLFTGYEIRELKNAINYIADNIESGHDDRIQWDN